MSENKSGNQPLVDRLLAATLQPLFCVAGKEIKDVTTDLPLGTISVKKDDWRMVFNREPAEVNQSGVYIFWWKVNEEVALPKEDTTRHWVKGKRRGKHDPAPLPAGAAYIVPKTSKNNTQFIHYAGRWVFKPVTIGKEGRFVPLYAGKSTNMYERVRQHLSWPLSCQSNQPTMVRAGEFNYPLIPRNGSTRQFSDGFHFLFRNKAKVQYAKLKYVHLSVAFTEYVDYAARFYAEDSLIGHLRPPFNLDSER